MTTILTINLI